MSDQTTTAATESPQDDEWLNDADDTEVVDEETQEDNEDTKPVSTDSDTAADADGADQPSKTDDGEPSGEKPNPDKPVAGEAEAEKTEADVEAERKRHNDEMAKRRISEKNALQSLAQEKVDAAKKEIEEAGNDETKREIAELKAKDVQRDADQFVQNVEHNQVAMENEASRAVREVSLFRPTNDDGKPNPDFNPKAYEIALQHLAPHIVTQKVNDGAGNEMDVIVGSNVSVYEFLTNEGKTLSSLFQEEPQRGAQQGQQAADKMHSRSEPGGTGVTKSESKEDREAREMEEAFDS